jgi:molybdopterin converting factor small subunit
MRIRVQFTAQLRTAVGRTADEVELPDGSSLAVLVRHLAENLEGAGPHLVSADGQIHRSLLVVVNDSAVTVRDAAAAALRDGDAVTLLPPIAGG